MPEFNVTAIIKVEISATFTVAAKDEDAATEKAKKLISEGKIGLGTWTGTETKGLDVEYEGMSEDVEIDYVEEA